MRKTLDVERLRTMTFEWSGFVATAVDAQAMTVAGTATGKLTIRGKTREVSMPVKVSVDSSKRVAIDGELAIKLGDYDVDPPSQIGVIEVADELKLWIAMRARLLRPAKDGEWRALAPDAAAARRSGLHQAQCPRRKGPRGRARARAGPVAGAEAEDLNGLFESVSIEGEQAAVVWKIYYHFASDGTFTAAAPVIDGLQPAFQTLSGTWKLDEQGLDLGAGQPVRASWAPEQLKLESEGTVVILRRVAIS